MATWTFLYPIMSATNTGWFFMIPIPRSPACSLPFFTASTVWKARAIFSITITATEHLRMFQSRQESRDLTQLTVSAHASPTLITTAGQTFMSQPTRSPVFFFQNNHDGTFREAGLLAGVAFDING